MKASSIEVADLATILLPRKWTILFVACLAGCAAFFITRTLPLRYSSDGGIVVESHQPIIPELSIAAPTQDPANAAIPTLVDQLHSHGLLKSVVTDLNLANTPNLQPSLRLPAALQPMISAAREMIGRAIEYVRPAVPGESVDAKAQAANASADALNYVQSNLTVDTKERSNVLSIGFKAGSPEVAASVVNQVMKTYISSEMSARRAELTQANEWLSQRSEDLRRDVEANDQQITKYLQDHDLEQVQGTSVAAVQLSSAQAQLAAARSDLARTQASRDTARQMASRGGSAAATQEALASPLIQALRQREADVLQRMGGLAANHPDRLRLDDELRSIRGQIGLETGKLVTSGSRDADVARLNVDALQRSVDAAQQAARRSSVAQVYLGQLTRDGDAKRSLYNAFVVRADQTRLASAQFSPARILFQATPAAMPDGQHTPMSILLGFFTGAFLAASAILLRSLTRDRISTTRDIMLATGLPVFGSLPELKLPSGRGALTMTERAESPVDETLRAFWMAMRAMTDEGRCTTVVITSSEVGEGKTTVATALARRVAADGFRVMLIDADLRRPRLKSALSLRPSSAPRSVLSKGVTLEEAIITDPASGLDCLLLADSGISNPMKLFTSNEFKKLLATISQSYDLVVLDSPPVLRVPDAIVLSQLAQLTLFVVASGKLSSGLVAEAIRRFPQAGRSKIMAVLTRVPHRRMDKRDYYGGYGTNVTAPVQPQPRLLEPGVRQA